MVSPRDLIFLIFQLPLHSVLGKLQPAGYHAVGSNVTLRTGYGGNDLTSVEWNHGDDNAVKWIEPDTTIYRNFEGRTFLNHTNGDLTLIGVTESESGEYTVSLNGKDSDTKLFIKVIRCHAVGSNVTLRTGYGGNDLTSVEWNHGDDNAVKWIEPNTTMYRNFEGRTFLNHTNGDLTLIGVTESESGEYTVSLNGKDSDIKLFIKVIHRVPVPTVKVNCSSEGEQRFCLYTCAGNTSQSEPVSYEWSHLNAVPHSASNKTIKVTMSLTGLPDQLFCTMKNPVSKATATTAPPLTTTAPPSPNAEGNGYFVSTVILPVILPVILLAPFAFIGVHRLMKGVWIWKKGSPEARIEDGSPIPLLDKNKPMNNLKPIVTTHDKETAF